MIKFFRQIRQKLLSESNFSRYLVYAIGEIILVVIGILIALQINNWNEDRKDRIKEQKILRQLSDEFKANLIQLESKIKLRENIMDQATEVLSFMDVNKQVNMDTLVRKISVILLAPTFDPVQNEELNSDKIQLIRNDSLRRYLSVWSSSVADFKEREEQWVHLTNNYTTPLLIDLGLSRNANISFYEDPENMNYLIDKTNTRKIRLPKSKPSMSVSDVLKNKKLEGILANAVLMNEGINWESESYRRIILDIIDLIESEIE